jgi:5-hydroxyisourate hydrolase
MNQSALTLSTHVLDTAHGCPAEGMRIRLEDSEGLTLAEAVTNRDGRLDSPILPAGAGPGVYVLRFFVDEYFARRGVALSDPPFLAEVPVRFGMTGQGHYHVPLLVSPYGYSTYRGS